MFTICPSCLRHFRLRAEQLAAAAGKVRCGYCQVVFNALEHLRDSDGATAAQPRSRARRPRPEVAAAASSAPAERAQHDAPTRLERTWDEPMEPYLLDVWAGTEAPSRTHPLWGASAAALLLLLCLQLSWNYRDELQSYVPMLQTGLGQLCGESRCLPRRQGSLAGLSILDRDIRFHPDYEDTILVNTTIINDSTQAMAYPNLQLRLLNEAAEPVAYREFTPMEYLHGGYRVAAGLQTGEPFHVLLELTGPVTRAASFELGFDYPVTPLSMLR